MLVYMNTSKSFDDRLFKLLKKDNAKTEELIKHAKHRDMMHTRRRMLLESHLRNMYKTQLDKVHTMLSQLNVPFASQEQLLAKKAHLKRLFTDPLKMQTYGEFTPTPKPPPKSKPPSSVGPTWSAFGEPF